MDFFAWYVDGKVIANESCNGINRYVSGFRFQTSWGFGSIKMYVDAIGYSWDSEYDVGDNINSHGKDVITELENEGWVCNIDSLSSVGITGEYNSYKKMLELFDNSTGTYKGVYAYTTFTGQTTGTVEWYFKITDTTKKIEITIHIGFLFNCHRL